jgi:hypothetical protein
VLPTSIKSETGTQIGRKGMLMLGILIVLNLFEEVTLIALVNMASNEVEICIMIAST